MSTLFITFLILLTTMIVMSVGLMFGRKPISGSCGGLKAFEANVECELCGGDLKKCPEANS